jgi:hypothetical protein
VTASTFLNFQRSKSVNLEWDLDLSGIAGLPIGATLIYWWILTDSGGNQYESATRTLVFEDPRFDWSESAAKQVVIHWYGDIGEFAQGFLDLADQAVTDIWSQIGILPTNPIHIRLYADASSMRESMPLAHEWTGGVSYPTHGLISIGVNQANRDWTTRALIHEIVHVAVGEASFFCGSSIPAWLNEGLATYAEGSQSSELTQVLNQAIMSDSVYSFSSLEGDFPYAEEGAQLAYAQSRSIVEYIIGEFGAKSISALLKAFQTRGSIDHAIRDVYGVDKGDLEHRWRTALGIPAKRDNAHQSPTIVPLPQIHPLTVPSVSSD